jgi:hypothetical protein
MIELSISSIFYKFYPKSDEVGLGSLLKAASSWRDPAWADIQVRAVVGVNDGGGSARKRR